MKNVFHTGNVKTFAKTVNEADCASFNENNVHPLYSTFALARDAEWCCRLFVLDMKDEDEEGIGTFIQIEHLAPVQVHATILFTATIEEIQGNEITCKFIVQQGGKLIARGKQKQKILKRNKLEDLYQS